MLNDDIFLRGFAAELIKSAGHPLIASVDRTGTMLGQKVKGMATRVTKRARGIQASSKGGSGLKGVVAKAIMKKAEEGDDAGQAGDVLKALLEEANARMNDRENEQGYNEQAGSGADDPSYGAGQGPGPGGAAARSSPRPMPSKPLPPQVRAPRKAPPRTALPPPKGSVPPPPPAPPAKAEPKKLPVDLD